MKSVSIIINNFNYGRYVSRCIESVLNQSWCADEVIVVDDGSTDNSPAILERYADRANLILKANGGQASAMNAGFEKSRGEWIWFLDADDWLLPYAVQRARQTCDSEFSRIQFRLAVVNQQGRHLGNLPKHWGKSFDYHPADFIKQNLFPRFTPTSGNLFHRSFLEKIMPIPEVSFRICADEYLIFTRAAQQRVRHVADVVGMRLSHGQNAYLQNTLFSTDRTILIRRLESLIRVKAMVDKEAASFGPEYRFPYSEHHLRAVILADRVLGEMPMTLPIGIDEATALFRKGLERQRPLIRMREWLSYIIVRYLPLFLVEACGRLEAGMRPVLSYLPLKRSHY